MKRLRTISLVACLVLAAGGLVQAAEMTVSITPNPVAEDTSTTVEVFSSDDITWVKVYGNGFFWFSLSGGGTFTKEVVWQSRGVYEMRFEGIGGDGSIKAEESVLVAVYKPDAGFVTGAGSIDSPEGAYTPEGEPTALTGKARFAFVSKYTKGATAPTGHTEFMFKAGDLNFQSDSYDWLVINQGGINAQFKGSGTINGEGDYKFMIWATDDDLDTFRIKIWKEENDSEITVYDNGEGGQAIDSGNIIVHTDEEVCSGCGEVGCDCGAPCIPPCGGGSGI